MCTRINPEVALPRGPLPDYRRLKEPILDEHVKASIQAVDGKPDSETGHYGDLLITGVESKERAIELKRGLFRAAQRQKVSMNANVFQSKDGLWVVDFRAISKAHARAFIIQKYGSDRSKWPYDPRRKNNENG